MKQIEVNGFIRVSKRAAQRIFNTGEIVYAIPCNLRPGFDWCIPFKKGEKSFSQLVNEAMYYNCNKVAGQTLWFYVYIAEQR